MGPTLRNRVEVLFAGMMLLGFGVLIWTAQRQVGTDPRRVEIQLEPHAPVAAHEIQEWIGARDQGKLKDIEGKLLDHEWIRKVSLDQTDPQVLRVKPTLRVPVAVWQKHGATPAYLDESGEVFGELNLVRMADLPLASGSDPRKVSQWIQEWNRRGMARWTSVASVQEVSHPDGTQEIRAVLLPWRATLHWEADRWNDAEAVIKYLNKNNIAPRQLWVQDSKKIVVKR